MAETWVDKRYSTGYAYLDSISKSCVENNFQTESGGNDVKGLHNFLMKLKGLDGDEDML